MTRGSPETKTLGVLKLKHTRDTLNKMGVKVFGTTKKLISINERFKKKKKTEWNRTAPQVNLIFSVCVSLSAV